MTVSPRAIVASVFPDASVESVTTPTEGGRKRTAIVRLAGGRTVVVQESTDASAILTEARLASAVAARTTIPVPEPLATGRLEGCGYYVSEYVDGVNLHERFTSLSGETQGRIARLFGRSLAELHEAFTFDRFGPVVADDGEFRATGPSVWEPWAVSYAERGVAALPDPFADLETPLLEAIRAGSERENPQPRLYPWDLRPGNAIVDGGEPVAIVDWGEPLSAAAGLSVAKTEHLVADWYVEDGTALRGAFREGYETVRPLPDVTRFERLTAVVRSAVDDAGEVTRPGYPERTGSEAVAFHRKRLEALL